MSRQPLALLCAVTFSLAAAFTALAGPLSPPLGPVAPTLKTLSEVEPRIAINATNTPGTASETFLITQPGSYYLTSNITMSPSKNAIAISTNDVTIDLNGYTITGVTNGFFSIVAYNAVERITVRNGSFRSSPNNVIILGNDSLVENVSINQPNAAANAITVGNRGVVRNCRIFGGSTAVVVGNQSLIEGLTADSVVTGVFASTNTGVTVRDSTFTQVTPGSGSGITASNRLSVLRSRFNGFTVGIATTDQAVIDTVCITNGTIGIFAGKNAALRNVEVLTMAASGITVGDASTLDAVSVRACVDVGITVTNDSALTRCRVSGSVANGISAGNRNAFTDCSSSRNTGGSGFAVSDGNTFTNCNADENAGDGFNARFGNIWRACGARTNTGDGIEASSGSFIIDSRFDGNGNGATIAANIRITGDASRIEANSLIGADFGIQTTSGGNLIIRNNARNNTNSYGGISSGNDVGPIGSAATATSPWANIQH